MAAQRNINWNRVAEIAGRSMAGEIESGWLKNGLLEVGIESRFGLRRRFLSRFVE